MWSVRVKATGKGCDSYVNGAIGSGQRDEEYRLRKHFFWRWGNRCGIALHVYVYHVLQLGGLSSGKSFVNTL